MSNSEPSKVLVVDDERYVRELLVDVLTDAGLEIHAAASGAEAIDLARRHRPDILVTDIRLGDCTGLEMIDDLRDVVGEVPAIIITGYGDAATLTEASRRRPIELMTKPLDLVRLKETVAQELSRQKDAKRFHRRTRQLRRLARRTNIQRKVINRQLDSILSDLTDAHQSLSGQMDLQKMLIEYQSQVIGSKDDDEVFEKLFRLFVGLSGPLFGAAMVCDADAQLHISGRFGVPRPDGMRFCEELARPFVDMLLVDPRCVLVDAGERVDLFCASIRRYLVGLTVLAIPLIPAEGELIGVVMLYRKGEQPFTDQDIVLAEMLAPATAAAVRRND